MRHDRQVHCVPGGNPGMRLKQLLRSANCVTRDVIAGVRNLLQESKRRGNRFRLQEPAEKGLRKILGGVRPPTRYMGMLESMKTTAVALLNLTATSGPTPPAVVLSFVGHANTLSTAVPAPAPQTQPLALDADLHACVSA